jgi:energy-coupling factor transport system ATP-binding protein
MEKLLVLQNATYKYPLAKQPAIKNVSYEFEKGKLYGIIGNNGSGKTTLCSLIRGFAPAFYKGELDGKVLVDGKATTNYAAGELAKKIGYVFQNPFNQISGEKDTVFEEIAFGLENFGVPTKEIVERVEKVMEITNITSIAGKNPFELSGGQQQRVALASIIVLEPEILVIDEPTSQLDPIGTEDVFNIIDQMKKKKKTIILVEHKIDLLAEYADEILVLNKGELVFTGSAKDTLSNSYLNDISVRIPKVTEIANKIQKMNISLDTIPITLDEAVTTFERAVLEQQDKE